MHEMGKNRKITLKRAVEDAKKNYYNKSYEDVKFLCNKVLAVRPNEKRSLMLLGNTAYQEEEYQKAQEYYKKVVSLDTNDPEARKNYSVILNSNNNINEAIEQLYEAITLDPEYKEAYLLLGQHLLKLKSYNKAIEMGDRILEIDNSNIEAYIIKCNGHLGNNDPQKAIEIVDYALSLNENHLTLHFKRGRCLHEMSRHDEALEEYDYVLKESPNNSNALLQRGNCLSRMQNWHGALQCFNKALEYDPNNPEIYYNRGVTLTYVGELECAQKDAEVAIDLNPKYVQAYRLLAQSKKFSSEDPYIKKLQDFAIEKNLDTDVKIEIEFTLGKMNQDINEYDKSFASYKKANDLKWQTLDFDVGRQELLFRNIATVINKDVVNRLEGKGHKDSAPIFVLGMPRSGTTLVEQIISSHPQVFGAGELEFLNMILAKEALDLLGMEEGFPLYVRAMDQEGCYRLGKRYIEKVREQAGNDHPFVTDKMPANFRFVGILPIILPQAKIIHCRRNPYDTCISCYFRYFVEGQEFSYNLEALGRYYRAYEKLMEHWRNILPESRMFEIQYEDLVDNFEEKSKELIDYCGLEWDDACLRFFENKRAVLTASMAQVRQPVYKSSVGYWKNYEKHLQPLFDAIEGKLGSAVEQTGAEVPKEKSEYTIQEALAIAWRNFESSKYEVAERVCNSVLQVQPRNKTALHLLGIVCFHRDNLQDAYNYLTQAVDQAPDNFELLMNLGKVNKKLEKWQEALDAFGRAAEIRADEPDLYFQTGLILQTLDRYSEAVDAFDKALELKPDAVGVQNNKGVALYKLGRLKEAVTAFDRVLELKPDHEGARKNYTFILNSLGKYKEATDYLYQVVEKHPEYKTGHILLGRNLLEIGRYDQALEIGNRLLEIESENIDGILIRARAYMGKKDFQQSLQEYDLVLEKEPETAEAWHQRGTCLSGLKLWPEAMQSYDKALQIRPDSPDIHYSRGVTLSYMGRIDQARGEAEKAIELNPGYAKAYRFLAQNKKFTPGDPHIRMFEKAAENQNLNHEQEIELGFALGKMYQDIQDYDKAFGHYKKANDLKWQSLNFDTRSDERFFKSIAANVDKDVFDGLQGKGYQDSSPIFILGMPRSGTTLVEQIVSSHPKVFGSGEQPFLSTVLTSEAVNMLGLKKGFPVYVRDLDPDACFRLGKSYMDKLRKQVGDTPPFITDKMPANFRFLGMIPIILPQARVIHCRRNPFDTCLSCFFRYFIESMEFSYNLEALARTYKAYEDLMQHWREILTQGQMFEIRYEDLVNDIEGSSRALIDYCRLEWDEACLRFFDNERVVETASMAQVRQPVYNSSVGYWKDYEKHLGPLFEILNDKDETLIN